MIFWTQILFLLGILVAGITVVLNILFAISVYTDVERLAREDKHRPVLVPGYVWAMATLIGGVFVAIGYWVVHRSSIARLEEVSSQFDIKDFLA